MDGNRRANNGGHGTPTRENPNVFDDEFEDDEFDGFGIADGFRPGNEGGGGSSGAEQQHPSVTSLSAHYADAPMSPVSAHGLSRDSTRKVRPAQDNPFASPEDGPLDRSASLTSHGTSQYAPGIAHRISSASSRQYAPASSPFGAADGPSHPYGMYAQDTIPRSPSVATTLRPSGGVPNAQAGPTHPYALYPQGVDADADEEALPQNPATVGFPGLGQGYQRRLGPDGEEQDIIGADGHLEQLPPYSRYPEDGPSKPLLASLDAPPPVAHSRGPVAGNDPGMPLMHEMQHATQAPQSMTDDSRLGMQQSHDRHPSMPNLERMHSESSSRDSAGTRKSWSEKSWKEKRKTKVMGVPFWWILLAGSVLAFIAIAIGSAIGGFLGTQSNGKDETPVVNVTVVSTSLYDASLIATPASASPPTGTFALSLSTPQETQAGCLANQDYAPAWSCDLAGAAAAAINVGGPDGESTPLGASLHYASGDTEVCYGTQRQVLETDFAPFLAVTDNDDPDNGPAFYFQSQYDKVVVLPEDVFNPNYKHKRQTWSLPAAFTQKEVIEPGEKPWFCYWNNTLLEGFIYVTNPVANSYRLNNSSSSSSSSSSTASVPASVIAAAVSAATAGYAATAVVSGSSPSSSSSSSSSSLPFEDILAPLSASAASSFTPDYPIPTTESVSFSKFNWREYMNEHKRVQHNIDDDNPRKRHDKKDAYETLGLYPYLVKIEERRLPNNPVQPFCQQFQILDDGTAGPLSHSDGSPITVELVETDPVYSAYESSSNESRDLDKKRKRAMVPGGCHCQWMSGQ